MPVTPIEYLYFYAKFRPNDAAIRKLSAEITWTQLLTMVRRVACKLRLTGIRANHLVITRLRDPQLDWIVTLALMHEAAVTCAALGPVPSGLEPDFVAATGPLADLPNDRTILIDDQWLTDMPPIPEDFKPQALAGDSLFRLILTSGTTGTRKAAEFSFDTILQRCERMSAPSNACKTELCMMGLATSVGFTLALRGLMRGLPFYCASNTKEIIQLIKDHQIECLSGSPGQLGFLTAEMQHTSTRLSSLNLVWYSGGEASPTLLDNIRRDLCPSVVCLYGSTEVGGVSSYQVHDQNHRPGMAGYIVPEAEVEIVNEGHQPLNIGEEGTVRIRCVAMATRYYKNPDETNSSYRDGWFYPGDRGRLMKNGALVLTARERELINRGGVKVSPAEIDSVIRGYQGLLDVATFGFENHLGVEDICAAVVVPKDFNMEPFRNHLAKVLGRYQNPSLILALKEIPRNQLGKIMRRQMREQYGEPLRQRLKAESGRAKT